MQVVSAAHQVYARIPEFCTYGVGQGFPAKLFGLQGSQVAALQVKYVCRARNFREMGVFRHDGRRTVLGTGRTFR